MLKDASTHKSKAQYMSAVWTNNPEQTDIAQRVAARQRKESIPILSASDTQWNEAEAYHQKYVEKMSGKRLGLF